MKHDQGKPRWSLFPTQVLWGVVKVLEFGAAKYEVGNWQLLGDDACIRFWDALGRHSDSMEGGEDLDAESGLPHAWHLCCTTLMFAWHFKNNVAARVRWQTRFQVTAPPSEPDTRESETPHVPENVFAPHVHVWSLEHTTTFQGWRCPCGAVIERRENGQYQRLDLNEEPFATYYQAAHAR